MVLRNRGFLLSPHVCPARTAMSEIPPNAEIPGTFPRHLREVSRRSSRRLFHPIRAGDYIVSAQASSEHASAPRQAVPATEVEAWEVAVFSSAGRMLDETVDPAIRSLPPEWRRYWQGGIARRVPTPTVVVLVDRFALGPDLLGGFNLHVSEQDGWSEAMPEG